MKTHIQYDHKLNLQSDCRTLNNIIMICKSMTFRKFRVRWAPADAAYCLQIRLTEFSFKELGVIVNNIIVGLHPTSSSKYDMHKGPRAHQRNSNFFVLSRLSCELFSASESTLPSKKSSKSTRATAILLAKAAGCSSQPLLYDLTDSMTTKTLNHSQSP